MPGLALFDLDNTLVDRLGAFAAWADRFVASVGGGPADVAWLQETDADGQTPLDDLFEAVRRRWQLPESPETLVAAYRETQADHYRPDPAIIGALQKLRDGGWGIAVVTNGAPGQRRKIERAGLAGLVDVVCISAEVGSRKPDPAIFWEACRQLTAVRVVAVGSSPEVHPPGRPVTVMIGDTPDADIGGAHALGFTTVWLDRGRPWPDRPFRPDHVVSTVAGAVDVVLSLGGA